MCGIVGVIGKEQGIINRELLDSMSATLDHRGPDARNVWVSTTGQLGFGHTRLKIIDTSDSANQPMFLEQDRFVLVFNGEIYNYIELRDELIQQGCSFQTTSDTEVLLQALAVWGEKVISRLNGMFAFALYDRDANKVLLARDRYGIKPLYICRTAHAVFFGSEIKALLAHPQVKASIDHEALIEYFTFQNFFTQKTLFEGVELMEQGTYQWIDAQSNQTRSVKYWDYSFTEPTGPIRSLEDYADEFDHLFRRAVQRNLLSDVPVGSYLSGGMDSGSITAIAAQELNYMRTFTGGFDMNSVSGLEIRFDERSKAEYMSYLFKTEHYEMVMKSGDMERIMEKLVYHLEEPRVGQSYPNYYAAHLASKFVRVVLSGTGGDELFGGYPWRYYRAIVSESFDAFIDEYYLFWQRLIPNRHIKQVFAPVWDQVSHVWTKDIFRDVFKDREQKNIHTPEEYLNHSLYLEARTFLHGLLVVDDKLSMASSLETRVPFLDNDLVDFAMKLPARYKLKNLTEMVRINENEDGNKRSKYFEKSNDGKLLMRKAMERYIPREVTDRVKQGFSAPDASWFQGDSIDYVKDTICTRNAAIYQYFDFDSVQSLVNEHLSGTTNRRLFIWSLLYFETFCKQFLK